MTLPYFYEDIEIGDLDDNNNEEEEADANNNNSAAAEMFEDTVKVVVRDRGPAHIVRFEIDRLHYVTIGMVEKANLLAVLHLY
jgi:hypothetical protein